MTERGICSKERRQVQWKVKGIGESVEEWKEQGRRKKGERWRLITHKVMHLVTLPVVSPTSVLILRLCCPGGLSPSTPSLTPPAPSLEVGEGLCWSSCPSCMYNQTRQYAMKSTCSRYAGTLYKHTTLSSSYVRHIDFTFFYSQVR